MRLKIGIGYDLHRLESGRKLFLGGVEIPFAKGLMGHSDGDCLVHAVIDALLGALGEKDIGQVFPDSDPALRGIPSSELLREIADELQCRHAEIMHIDTVIVAEAPKLASHIPRMKDALCPLLGLTPRDLGIKAKSNEGVGEIGEGRAIAAWAAVLVGIP